MDKIARLQKEWGERLLTFAYSYVHSYPVAEDLVQDVFLKIIESDIDLAKYNNSGALLYTILRNKCLDYIKHKMVEEKHLLDVSQANYLKANKYALEDDSIKFITDNEIHRILKEAINSLPDETKRIFILHKFNDKKYKEIAIICGISQRAVEYQLTKAMQILKKKLGEFYILLLF